MAPTIRTMGEYKSHQVYFVDFFGQNLDVTQTETPSIIRRWIGNEIYRHRRSRSSHPLVVGVGVQWTPSWYFSPPEYDRAADTLQLCVGTSILIVQLSHCNRVPNILRRFLANPNTTFVGFWNSQDERKLGITRHRLEIGELLDVRKYLADSDGRSLRGRSFGKIVEECMGLEGVRLDPRISKSDWSVGYLSNEQLIQASVDAYVSCKLGVDARLWQV
ncbi:Polynucleotidyl transferase [Hirschfeldia incana]|nr:Polynucleotidyl transferase [Hirschfeldia incana]